MRKTKWYAKPIYVLFALVLVVSFSLVTAVPAGAADGETWYVDPSGTDDPVYGTGTGTDAFKTITYAISQASDTDIIQVAAGIYSSATNDETFPINVTKAVTIESSGTAAETILDVGGGTVTGVILKAAATLDGFTINNASNLAINIWDYTEGGQLRTRAINNVINGAKLKIGNGCSNITVQGNIIDGGNILISHGDSDILIKGNEVSNFTTGFGIDMYPGDGGIGGAVNSDVVVEDNVLDNCNMGIIQNQGLTATLTIKGNKVSSTWGIGIRVLGGGSDITIENNEVHGCTDAVYGCGISVVGQAITMQYNKVYNNNAGGVSIKAEATGVVVNYNNIYGNTGYGLKNGATETVDATNNWWGTTVESEIEAMVSGNVTYIPWLTAAWPPPPTEVWVDDDFGSSTLGWGETHFDIIQDGIDNVAPSGTVNVAAGIYEEEIKIMDKSLTLLGAQADEPIVNGERAGDESIIRGKGTQKYGGSYRVVWIQHSDVVINGFTIESGKCIVQMQGLGAGISNISILYNYIEDSSRTEGFHAGISRANSVANVTIDHNYIASNPGRGIITNGGTTTITDNTFYGNGKGIDFEGGDPYEPYFPDCAEPKYPTIISGNTFTDDSTSIELRLDECHQSITITGNDITGARNDAIRTWNVYDKDLVNPAIHYNNIVGSTNFGINNPVTGVNLDATNNWWGDISGPSHDTFNPGGQGNAVSDNVNFSPWLGDTIDKTPMTFIVDDVGPEPDAGYIQAAIDAAVDDDTIIVAAGTYTPPDDAVISINKRLTLLGANAGVNPVTETRGPESIIDGSLHIPPSYGWGTVLIGGETGTVFDGFTVKDTYHYGIEAAKGATIQNNIVDNAGGDVKDTLGILLYGDGFNILNNLVTNCWDGIYILGFSNSLIAGNKVTNSTAAGEGAITFEGGCTNISITNNILVDNAGAGVYFWSFGGNSDITINYNNIYGNAAGVINDAAADPPVDATHNWWGDASGPSGVGHGTGDAVSENVDYDPWLDAAYPEGESIFFTGVEKEEVTDGTLDAKTEAATEVVVDGSATVTAAKYSDNPGSDFSGDIGKYIDVHIDSDEDVTELEIRLYYTDAEIATLGLDELSLSLKWWDGTKWVTCSPDSGVNTTDIDGYSGYMWARITATSTPSLSDLVGTPFGASGEPVVEPAAELLEYGDASDPTYPSFLLSDGARHNPALTEILGLTSTPDSKDFEFEANVPDLDLLDDGLVTTTITADNTAETVTFEVTDFIAPTSDLRVNILIDLNRDGDWADAGEHVVVNQPITTTATGIEERRVVSTPFSTVGATPGLTWLRMTLTRIGIRSPWDGTMADAGLGWDKFECGETEDWEITIEGVAPPPTGVGGTAYPVNKLAILAPWIALAAAIIAGATIFMRRRRAEG